MNTSLRLLAVLAAVLLAPLPRRAQATPPSLGCSLTAADWSRIVAGVSGQLYYYNTFNDAGDCASGPGAPASSLSARYAACTTQSLASAVAATPGASPSTCETALASSLWVGGTQTAADNAQLAGTMCAATLSAFVSGTLCNPLSSVECPQPIDLAIFSPFIECFRLIPNMTNAEVAAFWATGQDQACVASIDFCEGKESQFAGCEATLANVFTGIDAPWNAPWSCDVDFRGALNRCNWTYAYLHDDVYCATSIAQEYLDVIVLVPTLVVLGSCVAYVFWRRMHRANYISDDELLGQTMATLESYGPAASMVGRSPILSSGSLMLHPELHAALEKASRYRGVAFDAGTGSWVADGVGYATETDAGRAAYLKESRRVAEERQQRGASSSVVPPWQPPGARAPMLPETTHGSSWSSTSPPTSPLMPTTSSPLFASTTSTVPSATATGRATAPAPAQAKTASTGSRGGLWAALVARASGGDAAAALAERRKQELVEFYEYWDPDRPDIRGHVENLFRRHEFKHIVRAVLAKYGILPFGWELEL